MEVFVQIRKTYNLLGEVMDLSQQMAESLDRNDSTSFEILLSMRREPIQELAAARERVTDLLNEMSQQDSAYVRAILNGGSGQGALEEKLQDQVASNARLWEQVTELDRKLSLMVLREDSMYEKK